MSDIHTIAPSADLPAPYQPTPSEQAVLARHRARKAANPPSPRLRLARRDGNLHLETKHPKPAVGRVLLMEALGTLDRDFLDGLLLQLGGVGIEGIAPDEMGINFMLAMVKGIKPRDQIEAMMAAQMAAAHMITMSISRPLQTGRPWREQDIIASFTRLSRTFMAQIETLKRYRSVERQVTVEQVTVKDGGRAIVGQVEMNGVEMNGVGAAGTGAPTPAEENFPPTPWTGAASPEPHEAAASAPQLAPPTPWTGSEPAPVPGDADIASAEVLPPTPWTEAEAMSPPHDAEACGPENSPPTPWTGSTTPPTGSPPRPRRPGAYLQVLRENLAATP